MLGKITTTEAKAKELRPCAEKMLTRGRKDSLATRRYLAQRFSKRTTQHIVERAQSLGGRAGGYTRIIKLAPRARDAARMATIEMVG